MNEASTPATITSGQSCTGSLFIGPVPPPAVALRQAVDADVEKKAEDDEPEGEKLGGKPEVEGEVEKMEAGNQAAAVGRVAQQPDQQLEAEGHHPPAEQDGQDDRHLVPHVPPFGPEQVYYVDLALALHCRPPAKTNFTSRGEACLALRNR